PYTLYLKYPVDQTVVFPDSNYNFSPFELVSKSLTNTVSKDGFSFDSVTYYLRSFELLPLQTLRLPVYLIENGDSVHLFAPSDTIYLSDVEVAPEDPLKETTSYQEVD